MFLNIFTTHVDVSPSKVCISPNPQWSALYTLKVHLTRWQATLTRRNLNWSYMGPYRPQFDYDLNFQTDYNREPDYRIFTTFNVKLSYLGTCLLEDVAVESSIYREQTYLFRWRSRISEQLKITSIEIIKWTLIPKTQNKSAAV